MNHELTDISFVSGFQYGRCQTVFVYLIVGKGFLFLRFYLTEYNLYVVILFFFHFFLGFARTSMRKQTFGTQMMSC